jgi:hypothetical protein
LDQKHKKCTWCLHKKLDIFNSIMGLCSSKWCFLFPRCKRGEWDLCPIHHKGLDTKHNFMPCSNSVTTRLFLWMSCLGPMMWSTTYSHWWCSIFIS